MGGGWIQAAHYGLGGEGESLCSVVFCPGKPVPAACLLPAQQPSAQLATLIAARWSEGA